MREQLQALVDRWHTRGIPSILWVLEELKRILATEPPAVSVRAGWVAKDADGLIWFNNKPIWSSYVGWGGTTGSPLHYEDAACLIDPWETSHPNGGPECIMEVKP